MEIPKIYAKDIVKLCGQGSYSKGEGYVDNLFRMYQQGMSIYALCRGNYGTYRVVCTFDEISIVDFDCNCYAMSEYGPCKHLAALLITWKNNEERFEKREPLAQLLKDKSKDEITAILTELCQKNPSSAEALYKILNPSMYEESEEDEDEDYEDDRWYER